MTETILQTIKDLLGINTSYEYFDNELIPHLNGVLFTVYQIGITSTPFKITTGEETWEDLLGENADKLDLVKDYVFWKTKLAFDPPSSGTLMEALKAQIAESEWRLNIEVDYEIPDEDN